MNMNSHLAVKDQIIIKSQDLQKILDALKGLDYELIGPKKEGEAIIYDEISSIKDFPQGWTEEQNGGTYRLKKRSDSAFFGFTLGPQSWKKFLHPANIRLWQADRKEKEFQISLERQEPPKQAFIGVRSCELHAISVQDKVFIGGKYVDPIYQARRENIFIIAVNCGQAGGTCFCVSMKTGPKADSGFDLSLTELLEANRHDFLIEIGTERGAKILQDIPHIIAQSKDKALADLASENAENGMGRQIDTQNIKDLLYQNFDHPQWDKVATRCVNCANCTLVCPTCFCTTVEDVTDLKGFHAERWRKWDSCFTMDFSYIHGGSVRSSAKTRYRQWMTHKLASWIDQFGTSGCVGCGRCITWCPVAIDITEEVRAIRATSSSNERLNTVKEAKNAVT